MYNIIKKYCENENKNGLLLLNTPTGTGKTYNVLRYIADFFLNESDGKNNVSSVNDIRFFFITPLKKNLPKEELREMFVDAGKEEYFDSIFLFLDANAECILRAFNNGIEKQIPNDIKEKDEYKKLERGVCHIMNLRSYNDPDSRSVKEDAMETFRRTTEREFRLMIQTEMKKKYRTSTQRLHAVKYEDEWKWVSVLYPACMLREKKIVFMSVDKFLSPMNMIVEPSKYLYNSDILEGTVVFIDEFDSSKETVLQSIIGSNRYKHLYYIDMFLSIHTALHGDYPKDLVTLSPSLQENEDDNGIDEYAVQKRLDKMRAYSDEIYDEFFMRYNYKTESTNDSSANNFLFHDHRYYSALSGGKNYAVALVDEEDKINTIRFCRRDELPGDGEDDGVPREISIVKMLSRVHNFIRSYIGTVRYLALNYREVRNAREKAKGENIVDEFTLEEAVRTVLSELGIKKDERSNNGYADYLTSQILLISGGHMNKKIEAFDRTFYERGFCYYSFEDDYNHDMRSEISMCSYDLTPEKLLIRICEKAKVLGISATASFPSKVGNYDLDYIRGRLGDGYVTLTDEEQEGLRTSFYASQKYDGVNIHAELVGCSVYSDSVWENVVPDEDGASLLRGKAERLCPPESDDNGFLRSRYLRIAIAYKEFLSHSDIYSFLCVLNKFPKPNDRYLDLNELIEMFELIAQFLDMHSFDVKKSVVVLNGEDYENQKVCIEDRLREGEKLFVISTYQTIGAGQNLQYDIPDHLKDKLIKINDRPANSKKDFDAIYVDKPTNITPRLFGADGKAENFEKFLFYLEMLQHSGEISGRDVRTCISNAFRRIGVKDNEKKDVESRGELIGALKRINSSTSIKLMATRMVIQAVGRICRTNMKSPNIYIYGDIGLKDYISVKACHGQIVKYGANFEFEDLLDEIAMVTGEDKSPDSNSEDCDLRYVAQIRSGYSYNLVYSLYKNGRGYHTEDSMDYCVYIRNLTLKRPSSDVTDDFIISQYYVEVPEGKNRYWYKQENDYRDVEVDFTGNDKQEYPFQVSEEAAKLPYLMKVDVIRQYFEENGYATSFETGKYMLSPILFNNIYKGAVGEAAGKALFKAYADTELADIENPALYEKFDFYVPGTSVYVDFKNWHETMDKDAEKELEHIADKAKECHAKCVIIANVLADSDRWVIEKNKVDGVEIVRIPSLLVDNDNPKYNKKAWDEIRRCLSEYADR